MKIHLLCIAVALGCSACSNRGGYENVRQNHLQQCNAMPESTRKECIDRATGSYDAYQQDREALIEEKDSSESVQTH